MKRWVPGLLMAFGWATLLLFGDPLLFYLAVVLITAVAAAEFIKMSASDEHSVLGRFFLVVVFLLPVLFAGSSWGRGQPGAALVLAFLLFSGYLIFCYSRFESGYQELVRLGFGVLYVGFLASYLVAIRYLPDGGRWLLVLSGAIAGADTGAYCVGSALGKRKLCPAISPKKTVEGAVGGLLLGMIIAGVFAKMLFSTVSLPGIVAVGFVVAGVGMLGDLVESVVKRGLGVKDSGRILAGHGGVLDRTDSLLLAAPVFYYLLIFFVGLG